MGSKYSNRPPPRKKLWVCQKSPVALAKPSYPKSLLCTVMLKTVWGLPSDPKYQATFLLLPASPTGPYQGSDPSGASVCGITLYWGVGATTAYATGAWILYMGTDNGVWTTEATPADAPFRYASSHVQTIMQPYNTDLLITT